MPASLGKQNSPALLDAPGEWFLDRKSGVLEYLPRDGESPDTVAVIASRLTRLVTVGGEPAADGKPARPVRGLTFERIEFSHCAWLLPKRGYAAGQAGYYDIRQEGRRGREMTPAALTFDLAEDCRLDHCKLTQLGGAGVYFRRECRRNVVDGCTVSDVSGNGIMIGETFTRRERGAAADSTDLVSHGNQVVGNLIERCGAQFYGAVGVWIGIAANTTVAGNEIRELPYTGVSVGWVWNTSPSGCRGNLVGNNEIHQVMLVLSDGGGIYTLGRQPGTVLRGNRIHDIPANAGRAESNGMFLDQGSSLLVVEKNTIYKVARSPIRFHQAENVTLRENILVSLPGVPTFRYNRAKAETMTFKDNRELSTPDGSLPAGAN